MSSSNRSRASFRKRCNGRRSASPTRSSHCVRVHRRSDTHASYRQCADQNVVAHKPALTRSTEFAILESRDFRGPQNDTAVKKVFVDFADVVEKRQAGVESASSKSGGDRMRNPIATKLVIARFVISTVAALTSGSALADVRLSNDVGGGYISTYTLATGNPYTDPTLTECSTSRGRQNEPAVAVNPRNTSVIIGSSNDYCGVYNDGNDADGAPIASGPIWLGYYRSENGGNSFRSSLVPGYPGDTSPYAALAHIRTASSGDPVIAWDGHEIG